jgi:hypothetical protein
LEKINFDLYAEKLQHREACAGCGLLVADGWRVPGAGFNCSLLCVETVLFSGSACRWCGRKIEKSYTGIDSRLCSEDCSANYYARVRGDRSARVGSGVRLAAFLQEKATSKRHLTLEHRTKLARAQRARSNSPNRQNSASQGTDNTEVDGE